MNKEHRTFDLCIYICALLSGLVPRYISNFKIHVVIDISMYTIVVLITWMFFVRRLIIYRKVECWIFFVWLALIIGSIWRTERWGIWMYYIDWLATAILFMQIIYKRASVKAFEMIIRGIVDALFIQLLIGLYEIGTHQYLFEVGSISARSYGNVAVSMFYNLNDYSTFVVTILPLAIYLLFRRNGLAYKAYYSFICIISCFLTLQNGSRGALLGLALIIGVILLLLVRQNRRAKMLGLIMASLAVIAIVTIPSIRNGLLSYFGALLPHKSSLSDNYRLNLIKNGFYFLRQTYGFGVGAGNLYQWLSEKAIYPIGILLFIHNWYVEIAVTFGVLFFALYAYFHTRIAVTLFKSKRTGNTFWTIDKAIFASFAAFSVVAVSSSSNIYSEWVWMYLVFVSTYAVFCRKRSIRSHQLDNQGVLSQNY